MGHRWFGRELEGAQSSGQWPCRCCNQATSVAKDLVGTTLTDEVDFEGVTR
jgi:hypothetical protein